ncbi:biotin holocarboxylase synthetase [Dimargaris cristalligena]|nr:biotin holocarboxylase synthetase [Dimargaris cristalligena]
MNVLVYTGEGAARTCLEHTFYSLHQVLGHYYAVIPVTAKTLQDEPWESNTALLVFPGGRDLPYVQHLRGTANERIRRFIERGGKYLGLCAGGYYGCAAIEFEKGTPYSVCGPRELGFYPGICRGTVYPGFVYNSEGGARAVNIRPQWEAMARGIVPTPPGSNDSSGSAEGLAQFDLQHQPAQFRVYYNGGGHFVLDSTNPFADASGSTGGISVLAEYAQDRDGKPYAGVAMVGCEVGQGKAVLTGIHPEYNPDKLDPLDYQRGSVDLVAQLEHDNSARQLFWKSTLAYLGLKVSARNVRVPSITPILACAYPWADPPSFEAIRRHTGREDRLFHDAENTFHVSDFSPTLFTLMNPADEPAPRGPAAGSGAPRPPARSGSSTASTTSLDHFMRKLVVSPGSEFADTSPQSRRGILSDGTLALMLCSSAVVAPQFTPRFNVRQFFVYLRALGTLHLGHHLWYAQTTTSTQTILDQNPKLSGDLPSGLVFVASQQVRGRGRGKNPWISPEGCLQFSILLKYPMDQAGPLHSPVLLQYLFGLAVVEAVRQCPGYEDIPLRLKWPNDIYAELPAGSPGQTPLAMGAVNGGVRRVKIGGILVNSSFASNEFSLVIGTGVNCQNALPTTSINELIREHNRNHGTRLAVWSEELLLARILAQFERFYLRFLGRSPAGPLSPPNIARTINPLEKYPDIGPKERPLLRPSTLAQPAEDEGEGILPFLPMYYQRWLHTNQVVTLTDFGHARVKITGITPDYGYLTTLGVADGKPYTLQPGGNSFDMMAGLIGQKTS